MKAAEDSHIEIGVPASKGAKSNRHSTQDGHSCSHLQKLFYKHEHDRNNTNHAFNRNFSVITRLSYLRLSLMLIVTVIVPSFILFPFQEIPNTDGETCKFLLYDAPTPKTNAKCRSSQ